MVQVKVLDENIGMPEWATDGSAAFDLKTTEDLILLPNETKKVSSGLSIFLDDPGYCGLILPRSGTGSKGTILGNTVGLLDSDYQGPLFLNIWNRTNEEMFIKKYDRIAQMVIVPVYRPELKRVLEFDTETSRKDGGFGSTGL